MTLEEGVHPGILLTIFIGHSLFLELTREGEVLLLFVPWDWEV